MKASARAKISALALAAGLSLIPAAQAAMPVAQQNALVQKYCAVCHSDAKPTGGLSLEKFDAASLDPGVAAMMVSKLKSGAMSAAGIAQPDKNTLNALISALSAESVGASEWTVTRTHNANTQAPILTASVVQEVPSGTSAQPDVYRLSLTCRVDTHEAEMQLTWAPGDIPQQRGAISAVADGKAPFTYNVEQGDGAAILYTTKEHSGTPNLAMPLPAQTLTIGNLFPSETVVFPFGSLNPAVRQALSTCFAESRTSQ